jgi:predicted negative regulator of RcsB-dependent stress response
VDEYLSEKEQWERLVAGVRDNALWIVAGLAVGALAVGGWRWWQARTDQQALDAATRYDQILGAFDHGDQTHALTLIDELSRDHPRSPYVDQSNLAAARVFVETAELDRAALRLRTVMEHSRDHELAQIARLRLARVQISQGKADEALTTLGSGSEGAFAARFHEVRGDAYFAKGNNATALNEYRAARAAGAGASAENDVLNLKINDLSASMPVQAPPPAGARAPAAAAAK